MESRIGINKDEIFANMIHEIRTPLAVISTYAQMAVKELRRGIISEQTICDLETVSADARRLSNMATSTLDVLTSSADIEEGEDIDLEPIDVRTVIERVMSLLRHGKVAEHFEMSLLWDDAFPATCIVSGDEGLLMRLFWNVLSNAVTHSGGSKITARIAGRSPARICGELPAADPHLQMGKAMTQITVTDNGRGIPADIMPRLFDRGVSGNGGSGIGLYLCKEITRLLHGEIYTDTTQTSNGASFIILLPTAEE